MRWNELFADLEGQLDEAERSERELALADRVRRERSQVDLFQRLLAQRGPVSLTTLGGAAAVGIVSDVGQGWVLLDEGVAGSALVRLEAVMGFVGLDARADLTSALGRKFGLGYALRAISRDRLPVRVHDVAGGVREGHLAGVGADVVEVLEHPVDLPGRSGVVRQRVAVPFTALALVRPAP